MYVFKFLVKTVLREKKRKTTKSKIDKCYYFMFLNLVYDISCTIFPMWHLMFYCIKFAFDYETVFYILFEAGWCLTLPFCFLLFFQLHGQNKTLWERNWKSSGMHLRNEHFAFSDPATAYPWDTSWTIVLWCGN